MAGYEASDQGEGDSDGQSGQPESDPDDRAGHPIENTSDDRKTLVPDAVYVRSPDWMEQPPRWYLFCYVDATKNHTFSIAGVFHRFRLPLSYEFVLGDKTFNVPTQMVMQTRGWDEKVLCFVAALHFPICHVGLDCSADSVCFAE